MQTATILHKFFGGLGFSMWVVLLGLAGTPTAQAEPGPPPGGHGGFETWIAIEAHVLDSMRSGTAFRMLLPSREGEVEVTFQPTTVRSARYHAAEVTPDGRRRGLGAPPVTHFFGALSEGPHRNFARISHRPGRAGILGLMRVEGVLYHLGSESGGAEILLHVREITPTEVADLFAGCGLPDHVDVEAMDATTDGETGSAQSAAASALPLREIELGTEADAFFVSQTGGASEANAKILAIVNAINGIYEADLGLTNRVVVQRAHIGSDPYTTTDSAALLQQFAAAFPAGTDVEYDDAQLFSGRDFDGSTVGRAFLSAVCQPHRYGVNQYYSQNDSYLTLIAAHEEGHNLGAGHSDSGIMAPSINLNNVSFSAESTMEVDAYTSTVTCLEEAPVGEAPLLDPIGPRSVGENDLLALQLSGTDPDGDVLSFHANPLLPGASLGTDGRFEYQPPFDTVGCGGELQVEIEFSVTDPDGNRASEIVPITIADRPTGRAPTLSDPGDRSVNAGEPLAIQLDAVDPDGDRITFSALGLPPDATLGSTSGSFSWTPAQADVGLHAITFVAADCVTNLTSSQQVSIEVVGGTSAPHLDALSPPSGPTDSVVTIAGQDLSGQSIEVWFGERVASVQVVSDSSLVVIAPKQPRKTTQVGVSVVRDGVASDNALPFVYTKPDKGNKGGRQPR